MTSTGSDAGISMSEETKILEKGLGGDTSKQQNTAHR